jgi:hypothetical protein
MSNPLPVVVGLTLCQDVVPEPSGNVSLIRCFTGLPLSVFPATAPPFCVLATLTDAVGTFDFELKVDRVAEDVEELDLFFHPVHSLRGQVRIGDRLQEVRLLLRLQHCRFPTPGIYQFTLFVGGQWAAQRTLRVYLREETS